MILYWIQIILSLALIGYMLVKRNEKDIMLIICTIFFGISILLISFFGINKLITYYIDGLNYSNLKIYKWNNYENVIHMLLYWLVTVIILRIGGITKRINKRTKEECSKGEITGFNLGKHSYWVIAILSIVVIISSQFTYYEKPRDTKEESSYNNIYIESEIEKDVNSAFVLLDKIIKEVKDENITEIINMMYRCEKVNLVDEAYVKVETANDNEYFYPYTSWGEKSKQEEMRLFPEFGEYNMIILEYSFVEGRTVNDYYTIVIYGETVLDETVTCVHCMSNTDTLVTTFFGNIDKKIYSYGYEVLSD